MFRTLDIPANVAREAMGAGHWSLCEAGRIGGGAPGPWAKGTGRGRALFRSFSQLRLFELNLRCFAPC